MKKWIDETGMEIPVSRVTPSEKLREKTADALLKKAMKVSENLARLKAEVEEQCQAVFDAVMLENDVDPAKHKGNFTWYNFNRTIKIEQSVKERIEFDDALIAAAKAKFDEFITGATGGVDEMIRALVTDAFSTNKGSLDAKKIMSLIRHRQRVDERKYPLFHQAVDLIEQSIRRPDSKTYFRIWHRPQNCAQDKCNEGWILVNLNFSSL